MIISHRYKFIFVKTRKTAGTSIEAQLSPLCGEDDVLTPLFPEVPGHSPRNNEGFHNHMPAFEIKRRCPDLWHGYTTFCVERNPWDRTISRYFMVKNSPNHGGRPDLTLDEFLRDWDPKPNWPLYMDEIGEKIIVDRIVRYERLAQDIEALMRSIGLPSFTPTLRTKSEWRTDRRPPSQFLSAEQAQKIADIYAKEIALHGYELQ